MKMQNHWYLGVLGLIGIYKFPAVLSAIGGDGSWWDLSNALWLLWFLYFIPEDQAKPQDDQSS